MGRAGRLHWISALLVAALVTLAQIAYPPRPVPALPVLDASVYTSLAHQIATEGVMGSGARTSGPAEAPAMGMAPLYPAFLAGLMRLDDGLTEMAGCVRNSPDRSTVEAMSCRPHIGIALPVQAVLAMLCGFMVWVAGRMLFGPACGWLAMMLALATGHYAGFAGQLLTENLVLPLFSALLIAQIAALRRGLWWQWALVGGLLGLLTLTRPSYAYLAEAFMAVAAMTAVVRPRGGAPKAFAMLLLGCMAVLAPWLIRNWIACGQFGITAGYDAFTFIQRLAYNAMTPTEWAVSFLYWQPDIGEKLATTLISPAYWQRLGWDHPTCLYRASWDVMASSAGLPTMGTQIHDMLLPNLGWHLTTTLALAWRGLWLMRWWGLLVIPVAVAGMGLAAHQRRWEPLLFCLPAWFMLGFHAFVSVNVVRYNLILIPALTIMAAWFTLHGASRLRGRLGLRSRPVS